ncbi:hypothetical protein [Burkholderia sp. B21-007]|uniref:hypothetical protein n=1 Tax=Burkholderia sp. B21-007 TaxID=2890407 RepID=UPI001E62F16A|nr:hypothetical protein [Burkholderia sp. B21-007]UEP28006.1 hypothetical protein LMA01_00805 [Burkholderia sp. B21-007]
MDERWPPVEPDSERIEGGKDQRNADGGNGMPGRVIARCSLLLPGPRRTAVVDRPAVAARNDARTMQRNEMRRKIGAAHDAARDEVQVHAEERRMVVIHLAAAPCWIGWVGEIPDAVNLDGVELTWSVPDQPIDVVDCG